MAALACQAACMATWERPDFEHVALGAEVTAYLGTEETPL
jgi:coenzyme PQQ precursor peptide PqqA